MLRPATWTLPTQSQATTFVYDADGNRVKKVATSGTTVYIGSEYEVENGTATKHIFLGTNRTVSRDSAGNTYYYHSDHIGSSNVITDGSGSQVQLIEYLPYGEIKIITGSDVTDYKFTGKELDQSTGLYYYGARYYDASVGRFVTADPIVSRPHDPQDLNRYAYARNNPLIYIDPTGLAWGDIWSSWSSSFSSGWSSFTSWGYQTWNQFTTWSSQTWQGFTTSVMSGFERMGTGLLTFGQGMGELLPSWQKPLPGISAADIDFLYGRLAEVPIPMLTFDVSGSAGVGLGKGGWVGGGGTAFIDPVPKSLKDVLGLGLHGEAGLAIVGGGGSAGWQMGVLFGAVDVTEARGLGYITNVNLKVLGGLSITAAASRDLRIWHISAGPGPGLEASAKAGGIIYSPIWRPIRTFTRGF